MSPDGFRLVADLWELNRRALVAAGIPPENIERIEGCTMHDDRFFSHFVPKASYASVGAGWYACVATGLTDPAAPSISSNTSPWIGRLFQSADPNIALWFVLLALIVL